MSQGRGPRRRQYPLDKAKKLNFKILRSRDYGSCLVFAVLKLNRSCYVLLAARNTYYRLQTLNLTIICVTDSRVNWKIIQAKRFTSSSEVAKPTFSTRNCLQRSLIGKHSNCIVRPLEVILKETNSHFEEKEPYYDCTLASTECDAVLLNLLDNQLQTRVELIKSNVSESG